MNEDPSRRDDDPSSKGGNAIPSFDRAAGRYDRFSRIQREMADWLAEWLPKERISGRFCEVAAGTGHFTRHLAPREDHGMATDGSVSMVQEGRRQLPGIRWAVSPAEQLPNPPVNWIFSSSFLQWTVDPDVLFQSWRQGLAPDGRILAGLFVAPTLWELEELLPGKAPLAWRTADDWQASLARSGYRLLRDEASRRKFVFPSALELFRCIHYVGAAPKRVLSAGEMRKLLRDYTTTFGDGDGVRSTWMFYRFEAAKNE